MEKYIVFVFHMLTCKSSQNLKVVQGQRVLKKFRTTVCINNKLT